MNKIINFLKKENGFLSIKKEQPNFGSTGFEMEIKFSNAFIIVLILIIIINSFV